MKSYLIAVSATAFWIAVSVITASAQGLTSKELLGKALFFDTNLSTPVGQSCAACHDPEAGWAGPDSGINAHGAVYPGAVPDRFGNRKPPSSAYATPSPILDFKGKGVFTGGNFWDGRATGEKLGNPAADQAQGPFLNQLEQANASPLVVCEKVEASGFAFDLTGFTYEELFNAAFGTGSLDCVADVDGTYDRIALAIAAYEGSSEVNQYSSKFDYYLAGFVELSPMERQGFKLFRGSGKCAHCHSVKRGPNDEPPLFTDFTFHNLGVPKNPENPFYTMPPEFNPDGANWIDQGLGGFLESRLDYAHFAPQNYGRHKVPTLRNVDLRPSPEFVKSYGHNGFFKTLKEIVHFYNTRDVLAVCPDGFMGTPGETCWPPPEVPVNVNDKELGDLGLTDQEEDAIVVFMKTLSDGFVLPMESPMR